MNIKMALQRLDELLKEAGLCRDLIICGGAVLYLMDKLKRVATYDIDVLSPIIDHELKRLSYQVSEELGIPRDWLNNGPVSIIDDLGDGWDSNLIELYSGTNLIVYSISRKNLIFSKLNAIVSRGSEDDLNDLLGYSPTEEEIETHRDYFLKLSDDKDWADFINSLFKRVLNGK